MSGKKLGNNAGVSLLELLVALAVSSIVIVAVMTLLTNGVESYRRQTVTAQLQEEADIALTHMTDAVMEAEVINVKMSYSENGSTQTFYITEDESYGYEYDNDNKILNVVTKDAEGNKIYSVLCSNVKKFKVQMLTESVKVSDEDGDGAQEIIGVNDVVQIKINIELESGNVERTAARVAGVRNTMGKDDVIVVGFDLEKYTDVQYLKTYGFLVDE